MPKLPEAFDATQHETQTAFDPLPAGWYNVAITGSSTFLTKAGTECLKLELTVLDGDHANRKLWDNLNLWHTNPEAVRIAQTTLATICTAIGRLRVGDTEELHNQPMQAKVSVETDATYGSRNSVKGYRGTDGKVTPIQTATAAPPAATTKSPPWLSKKG